MQWPLRGPTLTWRNWEKTWKIAGNFVHRGAEISGLRRDYRMRKWSDYAPSYNMMPCESSSSTWPIKFLLFISGNSWISLTSHWTQREMSASSSREKSHRYQSRELSICRWSIWESQHQPLSVRWGALHEEQWSVCYMTTAWPEILAKIPLWWWVPL